MTRSTRGYRRGFPATLVLTLFCLTAQAEARGVGPLEIGVFSAVLVSDEELAGTKGDVDSALGVRIGGQFSHRWGWYLDAQQAEIETQTFAGDATIRSGRGGVELLLQEGEDHRAFYTAGWGYTTIDFDAATDFSSAFASLGLGQQIRLGRPVRLRWEARVDRTLAREGLRGEDLTQLQLLIGFNWGVGRKGPRDADGDGVPDRRDRCAGTPPGARVDGSGCSADRDGDGVEDSRDRCAGTPAGWAVGDDGCPSDSDGDGVPDGRDACPETRAGIEVGASGCPGDGDGDGVHDGEDRCPRTIKGIEVDETGCFLDADGDGVYDGLDMDKCPGTPPGTKVDAHGCPVDG